MLVTVPEDGIYGFRMTMESDPRLAGRPPLSGEQPGIWIGIDLSGRRDADLSAQQGAGREGDKLFITWEASDNRDLAPGPIGLSYSERPGVPWTAMASGLENTGRYAWQLAGSLPPRIYLRLEIHDAAGNLGRLRDARAGLARSFQPGGTSRPAVPPGPSRHGAAHDAVHAMTSARGEKRAMGGSPPRGRQRLSPRRLAAGLHLPCRVHLFRIEGAGGCALGRIEIECLAVHSARHVEQEEEGDQCQEPDDGGNGDDPGSIMAMLRAMATTSSTTDPSSPAARRIAVRYSPAAIRPRSF